MKHEPFDPRDYAIFMPMFWISFWVSVTEEMAKCRIR